ncbi:MAG: tyrosine-type recombinase/integrase, partial [Acidimicrobiales bacterium]
MSRVKQSHGSGSVRWRAGAWRVQVYAGRHDDGRPRFESRTVHGPHTAPGRRRAEGIARELFDQARRRARPPGSLAEHIDRWIEHRAPDWAPGEAERNRRMLAHRVMPTLGTIPLDRLGTIDIDACYASLRRRGLSAGSIRRTHGFLHSALEQAVKWRLIDDNPAATATVPGQSAVVPTWLPEASAIRAMMATADAWLAMLNRLAVHTGGRTGELVSLRWDGVDLTDQVLRIWQSKTRKWKVLAVGTRTVAELDQWREMVAEQYASLQLSPMPDDWWVFPSPRNPAEHVTATGVSHAWARRRDAARLSGV